MGVGVFTQGMRIGINFIASPSQSQFNGSGGFHAAAIDANLKRLMKSQSQFNGSGGFHFMQTKSKWLFIEVRSQSQFNGSGGFHKRETRPANGAGHRVAIPVQWEWGFSLHFVRRDAAGGVRESQSQFNGSGGFHAGVFAITHLLLHPVAIPVQWEWGFSRRITLLGPG